MRIQNGILLAYDDYEINKNGEIIIPEGVKKIKSNCFEDCPASGGIICPSSLEIIGERAFCKASIKYIEFPKNSKLTRIEKEAFKASELIYFNMPDNVNFVGNSAFEDNSSLESVKLNDNLLEIPESCFMNCFKLRNIELPSKLERLCENSFFKAPLSELIMPDTLKTIDKAVFNNHKFRKVYISKNLRYFFDEFYDINFEELIFPNVEMLELFLINMNFRKYLKDSQYIIKVLSLKNLKENNGQFLLSDFTEKETIFNRKNYDWTKHKLSLKKLKKIMEMLKQVEQIANEELIELNPNPSTLLEESNKREVISLNKEDYSIGTNNNNVNLGEQEIYEQDEQGRIWINGDLVPPAKKAEIEKGRQYKKNK